MAVDNVIKRNVFKHCLTWLCDTHVYRGEYSGRKYHSQLWFVFPVKMRQFKKINLNCFEIF